MSGGAALTEESGKVVGRDGQRLAAGAGEGLLHRLRRGDAMELKTPEAPWIHKTKVAAGSQVQDAVGVGGYRRLRIGDQQTAGHAQMDDPLQRSVCQIEDNVLADTVDALDAAALELGGHELLGGLKGFRLAAEPGAFDAVSADAFIDSAGDGFDFG